MHCVMHFLIPISLLLHQGVNTPSAWFLNVNTIDITGLMVLPFCGSHLSLFRLLAQNTINWVVYKQQTFVFHSPGGWEFQDQGIWQIWEYCEGLLLITISLEGMMLKLKLQYFGHLM